MRNMETNHPDWKDLQKGKHPSRWPSMKQACYKKAYGNQIKRQVNYEWGTG